MRTKSLYLMLGALLALLVASAVHAADLSEVVKVHAGANGTWFDGPATAFPSDVEAGGSARASLSPHISIVGGAWYGFANEYIRYSFGPRVTVTDVNNPNFSVGVSLEWNGSSREALQPNEWCPTASVGWVPMPEKMPALTLIGQGSYGLDSDRSRVSLGLRYTIALQ